MDVDTILAFMGEPKFKRGDKCMIIDTEEAAPRIIYELDKTETINLKQFVYRGSNGFIQEEWLRLANEIERLLYF